MPLCDFDGAVVAYKGYGNIVRFPIASPYTLETPDLENITSAAVCVDGVLGTTGDSPAYVAWAEEDGKWFIDFQPGMFANLSLGEVNVSVIVYTTTHTNGIVLHTFKLNVVDPCA